MKTLQSYIKESINDNFRRMSSILDTDAEVENNINYLPKQIAGIFYNCFPNLSDIIFADSSTTRFEFNDKILIDDKYKNQVDKFIKLIEALGLNCSFNYDDERTKVIFISDMKNTSFDKQVKNYWNDGRYKNFRGKCNILLYLSSSTKNSSCIMDISHTLRGDTEMVNTVKKNGIETVKQIYQMYK